VALNFLLIFTFAFYVLMCQKVGTLKINNSSRRVLSSVCSCTDASTTKLLGIWPTTAHQFRSLFPPASAFSQQSSSLLSTLPAQPRTAVGLFLLLVGRSGTLGRSGTHCPKTCGIRSVLWTVTDSHWRHFYFHLSTSVFSALEVCYENALYKFTFDIWHWYWYCWLLWMLWTREE